MHHVKAGMDLSTLSETDHENLRKVLRKSTSSFDTYLVPRPGNRLDLHMLGSLVGIERRIGSLQKKFGEHVIRIVETREREEISETIDLA